MFCPQCGKQIPDTSKVCGFCAHQIQRVSAPPPPPPVELPFNAPEPEAEPVREISPEPVIEKKTEEKTDREGPAKITLEKPVKENKEQLAKQPRKKPVKKVKKRPAKQPRVKPTKEVKERSAKQPRKKPVKKVKERPAKQSRVKPTKEVKERSAKQPRVKPARKPRERPAKKTRIKPIPWKWILPAIGSVLVLIFLILVYFAVLPLPGLQQSMELYLPSPNATRYLESQACGNNYGEYAEIRSSWLDNQVRIDGKPSSGEEWGDATCTLSTFRIPTYGEELTWEDPIRVKWWIKNDAEWVYLLVRLPVKYGQPGGVYFDHFWPGPYVDHWQFSDGVSVSFEGKIFDLHDWDGESWKEDSDYGGKNHSKGAFHEDNQYYWFEFKKPLDSDEDLDWSWRPGGSTGTFNSTLLGFWGLGDNFAGHQLDLLVTFATK